VNDFWVEYEKKRIHQFYSNLSVLDPFGLELQQQTISVNNPLRFQGFDFYQSDWNLLGIRIENQKEKQIYEIPLFSFPKTSKAWVTWIPNFEKNFICVFDQFENFFAVYDQNGIFIGLHDVGEWIPSEGLPIRILEILPSTGLLLKYDPSISFIYLGFGLLMITTCLSYLPYTQIWLFQQRNQIWIGSNTNRGKIQLEIEFENLIRFVQNRRLKG
jgi:cytochrome c biogenesis protein